MLQAITHVYRRDARAVLATVAAAVALTLGAAGAMAQSEPQQVQVNESITVELDGNPSTGYRWELDDGASEDSNLVKVEDLGYAKRELKPGERPLLGAPSKYQFRITGLEAGTAKRLFMYVRDKSTPPGKTQEVAVEVIGD
jgi:predicted secreted protein